MAVSAVCVWLGVNLGFIGWRLWIAKAHPDRVHILDASGDQ
jgi:hypothetical protein